MAPEESSVQATKPAVDCFELLNDIRSIFGLRRNLQIIFEVASRGPEFAQVQPGNSASLEIAGIAREGLQQKIEYRHSFGVLFGPEIGLSQIVQHSDKDISDAHRCERFV